MAVLSGSEFTRYKKLALPAFQEELCSLTSFKSWYMVVPDDFTSFCLRDVTYRHRDTFTICLVVTVQQVVLFTSSDG